MFDTKISILSFVLITTLTLSPTPSAIAAHTKIYGEKQGFTKKPRDIITTLKVNEVTQFQSFLDGLQQGFDLDKTLRGKGPFTVFAPSDKAFKGMPSDDFQALFGDKKRLKKVMSYHIVSGQYKSEELRKMTKVKTLEGSALDLSVSGDGADINVNHALVNTADIPCTNGIIHVIDQVLQPPAKQ